MERDSNRRYFKWGLTALVVIFISILLVVIFTNLPGFFTVLASIGKILSPLISGVVIAFLLNPLVNAHAAWHISTQYGWSNWTTHDRVTG